MADFFVERSFPEGLTEADVRGNAHDALGCFELHRVEWRESLLSADAQGLLCWFHAPDAEGARTALRKLDADLSRAWPGTVHDAPDPPQGEANVVVERSFPEPVTLDEIQAIEDAGAWCLETHKVKFVRTYFSTDRKRMLCLYRAPDAESVRLAQRQAEMPLERVWAFKAVRPA